MKKTLLIITFFGLISFALSQTVTEIADEIIVLSKAGEFEKALLLCNSVIEKYPKKVGLYVLRGDVIRKFGLRLTKNEEVYQNALKDYVKALSLDPSNSHAYSSRAKLNLYHQNYNLAIDDFTSALKFISETEKQDRYFLLLDRATAKSYLKDLKGATKDLKTAQKIFPEMEEAYINLGIIYMNGNLYGKSKKEYDKALKINPLRSLLLNNLGLLFVLQGKYGESIPYYEKAIDISPESPLTYNNLGFAKVKSGAIEEGLALINKSLKIYPANSYAYKNRAIAFIALDQIDKACEDLEKANELGYTHTFDNEVIELIKEHCKK